MNNLFTTLPQILFFAFVITMLSIYVLKPIAYKYGLVDITDHRKHHVGEIPLIGGIAMYCGILFSAFFLLPKTWVSMTWLFASAGIVVLGALDDAKDLPVKLRLIVQSFLTLILSIGSGYYLADLGNILGLGNVDLGVLGYLVTVFAVICAINAFNMMDGIDGLAGMMALVSFGSLAILFWINADSYGFYVSCILLAVILPYLANNLMLPPFKRKIFMGDAGAMLIGFSVVWLLIYGSQSIPPGKEISFRPITALYLIAIPLLDIIVIIIKRIQRGSSPFTADRDHLHHMLMGYGYSSKMTLVIITVISTLIASIGIIGNLFLVPEVLMLIMFIFLFIGYSYSIKYLTNITKKTSC